jgi:hypothetical protein
LSTVLWWYLQEPTGWLVVVLGPTGGIEQYPWHGLLIAAFAAVSVLYAVVGVRVWRGGRTAGLVATVVMLLGAAQSLFMFYASAVERDSSIAPFGHGPIVDRLVVPVLFLWPLMLLSLAVTVVVLVNTTAARGYRAASDRAASAALLNWKDTDNPARTL